MRDSNPRPCACKAPALATAPIARKHRKFSTGRGTGARRPPRILVSSELTRARPRALASKGETPCAPTTLLGLCSLLEDQGILVRGIEDEADAPVTGAACDSRFAREGNVFFCKGRAFRTSYLASALEAGAVAYACEQDRADELAQAAPGAPAIVVSDMRRAMALVSARAFGRPDLDVPQVGITGTKGKSTTAYMLRSIIDAAGGTRSCGIIGSIDTYDGIEDAESTNTTPEAPDLWRHLANARDAQLSAMVMEVSSQALKYDRTLGVQLDVAAFLNIGSDHISPVEHPTFEDYFASKLRIFSQCHRAVVNLGTSNLERVLDAAHRGAAGDGHDAPELVCVSAAGPEAVECGSCDMVFPDIWATDVEPRGASLAFVAHGTTADGHPTSDPAEKAWELPVVIGFPGLFNVENALVAIACAELLGIDRTFIAQGLASCRVPGRMELIGKPESQVLCVVD